MVENPDRTPVSVHNDRARANSLRYRHRPRIAIGFEELPKHQNPQSQSRNHRSRNRRTGSKAGWRDAGGCRLTLRCGFHTIRTV